MAHGGDLCREQNRTKDKQEKLQPILRSQDLGGPLANDDAGSLRIAGGHPWQDRAIRHPKVADAIDVQMVIHHRQGISAHLGRAGLMPVGYGGIAAAFCPNGRSDCLWRHGYRDQRERAVERQSQAFQTWQWLVTMDALHGCSAQHFFGRVSFWDLLSALGLKKGSALMAVMRKMLAVVPIY